MKINAIEISGYRQFKNMKLNFEHDITVLAGSNNSGKTSIIELLSAVLGTRTEMLTFEDFSIDSSHKWAKDFFERVHELFTSESENLAADIVSLIFPNDESQPLQIPPIEVRFDIGYDEKTDDIRNFSDYMMELTNDCGFYFKYVFTIDKNRFQKNLDTELYKIKKRFTILANDAENHVKHLQLIQTMLLSLYAKSISEHIYYTDKKFENVIQMKISDFKKLFNFANIRANRILDDESADNSQVLSKQMIDIASQDNLWEDLIDELPDQILTEIEKVDIKDMVYTTSLNSLQVVLQEISKSNGGNTGNIALETMVNEQAIKSLLANVTSAKYQVDDCFLKESAQGLGYSNLIYMHIELEKYKRTIDFLVVNIFIIEEPESHMHPQMQHAFTEHLHKIYKEESNIQGVLTTHSHEVVRSSEIHQLRVLRKLSNFECELYDFRDFCDRENVDNHFFNALYEINFADIIFADKVIIYEGDTEKMFIKNLINTENLLILREQYLSFVQVGGAYAHKYEPLINFLGIKTLIITDIDYEKSEDNDLKKILMSESTNEAINHFYKLAKETDENPKIQNLYSWANTGNIKINNHVTLAFQGKEDHYARTLEEAMLAQILKTDVFKNINKSIWQDLKDEKALRIPIPNSSQSSIHDRVQKMSKNKTDFMYSVILKNLVIEMLPKYIREGLTWLKD